MIGAQNAPRTLGGYEVLSILDEGGMGEVYIARKRGVGGFDRLVALKTMKAHLAEHEQARRMFLDEGKLLSRLHHSGIAQVYDFGEDGDRLYLAMEYVAGVDFRYLAGDLERSLPPAVVCLLMADATRALHAAHELTDRDGRPLGVVHRDVSPGNLMLTFDGAVKVLDFGIALMRGRQAPVTEFGMLKGKPPYLSPEQVKNETVSPRSDIFSACAVLHELLTGEQVFDGDSIYAIARSIEDANVAPPSAICGALPAGIDSVVMRGLAKDPADRWGSALELSEALREIARREEAESLDSFARRELAELATAHRERIGRLLRDEDASAWDQGRPTGVHTVPAIADDLDMPVDVSVLPMRKRRISDGEADFGAPRVGSGAGSQAQVAEAAPTTGAGSMRWLVILALLLAVAVVGVVLVVQQGGDQQAAADFDAAVAPVDAGPAAPDAAVVMAPPPDAAPLAPPDAAQTARDADKPKRPKSPRDTKRDKPDKPPPGGDGDGSGSAIAVTEKPTGSGTLAIMAKPWAQVFVNGSSWGPTPKNRTVPAGSYFVKLVDPATNEVRYTKRVTIVDGATKRVVAPKKKP